jgi:hypothetical protein
MILAIALPAASASAQQLGAAAPAPARNTVAPVAVGQNTPRPAVAAAPAKVDPRIDTSDVNLSVTVKITDKAPSGDQTKTVSLMFSNQSSGRVRSSGSTLSNGRNQGSDLNVDAQGTLMKSGQIRTNLTIIYQPEWTDDVTKMTGVTQSASIYLTDGRPVVITQAADPTKGTRSVAIEVTAKVIK